MSRTFVVLALLVTCVTCEWPRCPDGCVCPSTGTGTGTGETVSPETCAVTCEGMPIGNATTLLPFKSTNTLRNITQIWPLIKTHVLKELRIRNCNVKVINSNFEGLTHLIVLDLSNNNIVNMTVNILKTFTSLKSFNLHGNNISIIGDSWLRYTKNLSDLDLSSNNITVLDSTPFALCNLLRLNLSRNHISSLNSTSLSGLDNLQSFDLSSNLISFLDNSIFHPLSSLQWLNLSGNHLEMLSEDYFIGLAHLQTLDVSVNRISSISPGSFESLSGLTELVVADNPLGLLQKKLMVLVGTGRHLQTVDASWCNFTDIPAALTRSIRILKLSNNLLTSIRCGDLDSYPLLKTLDLSNNKITEMEEDALGRLEELSTLFLSGNKLSVVPNTLPKSLKTLHLNNNNIEYLNVGDLDGLSGLSELILSQSRIIAIQDGAFSSVDSLEVLDLSNNPVQRLQASVLAGPQRLRMLRLSHLSEIISEDAREMSFPVSSPERLEVLELNGSPVLSRQLLGDTAALAAFRQLRELNLIDTNVTYFRSDLFHFLPRLEVLRLSGNLLACDDIMWLTRWMQQQKKKDASFGDVRCASPPSLVAKLIVQLKDSDFNPTTSSTSSTVDIRYGSNTTLSVSGDIPPDQSPQLRSTATRPSVHSIHLPSSTPNEDSTLNIIPRGEEASLKIPFLNESRGLDSTLEFPTTFTVLGLNSLLNTTNVNSSLANTTQSRFLPIITVPDQNNLKNSRNMGRLINAYPTAKSISSSTLRNSFDIMNKTKGLEVNNTTLMFHNSTITPREFVNSKDQRMIGNLFNNGTIEDINNLRNISLAGAKVQDSESISNVSSVRNNTGNALSSNKPQIYNSKNTTHYSNAMQATLRSANKKILRNSLINTTVAHEVLRGDKSQVDKMIIDRLASNNRLRTNENYSRVKSSGSSTSQLGPGFTPKIASTNETLVNHNVSTDVKLTPNDESTDSVIDLSTAIPSITSIDYLLSPPQQGNRNLSNVFPLIPDGSTPNNQNNQTKHIDFPHVNSVGSNKIASKNVENTDDDSNSTAVWGTIRSTSNINLSTLTNSTELFIGIVHTRNDPKLIEHYAFDKTNFNRPRASNSHIASAIPRRDSASASDSVSDRSSSISEKTQFLGSHPGMLILIALGLGVAAVFAIGLSHCVKRRRRLAVEYSRQQDIEVRSMTSLGERERW